MRIQEASIQTGLSLHTLRYYEKQGLIYPVPRDESGHRFYRQKDIHWLHFVQCLKMTGMPLKDIRAYASNMKSEQKPTEFLLDILQQHKQRLQQNRREIDECLGHINWKIEHYTTLV